MQLPLRNRSEAYWRAMTEGGRGRKQRLLAVIICYLLTKSEVITGKSQTEALMY